MGSKQKYWIKLDSIPDNVQGTSKFGWNEILLSASKVYFGRYSVYLCSIAVNNNINTKAGLSVELDEIDCKRSQWM